MTSAEKLQKMADALGVSVRVAATNANGIFDSFFASYRLTKSDISEDVIAKAAAIDRELWKKITERVERINKIRENPKTNSDSVSELLRITDPNPQGKKMASVTKKDVVALFKTLGCPTADQWNDARIQKKVSMLLDEFEEELEDLTGADAKLANVLKKAIENEEEIEITDGGESKPAKAEKPSKSAKPAKTDDDGDSDEEDEADDEDAESDEEDEADDEDAESESDDDEDDPPPRKPAKAEKSAKAAQSDDSDDEADDDDDSVITSVARSEKPTKPAKAAVSVDDSDDDEEMTDEPGAYYVVVDANDFKAMLALLARMIEKIGNTPSVKSSKPAESAPVKPAKAEKPAKSVKADDDAAPADGATRATLSEIIAEIREYMIKRNTEERAVSSASVLAKLVKAHPDRAESWLKEKLDKQLPGFLKQRDKLDVRKTKDGRYWVAPAKSESDDE